MRERKWSSLEAGEMKFVGAMRGKIRRGRVWNEDIRNDSKPESTRDKVENMSFRLYGPNKKMTGERIPIRWRR